MPRQFCVLSGQAWRLLQRLAAIQMSTTLRIVNFANRIIAGLVFTVAASASAHVAQATTIDLAGTGLTPRFFSELRDGINARSVASNDRFRFAFDGLDAGSLSKRTRFQQRFSYDFNKPHYWRLDLRWRHAGADDRPRGSSNQQADRPRAQFEWARLWWLGPEPFQEGMAQGFSAFMASLGPRWDYTATYSLVAENWLHNLFFRRVGGIELLLDNPDLIHDWTADDHGLPAGIWGTGSGPEPAVTSSP